MADEFMSLDRRDGRNDDVNDAGDQWKISKEKVRLHRRTVARPSRRSKRTQQTQQATAVRFDWVVMATANCGVLY